MGHYDDLRQAQADKEKELDKLRFLIKDSIPNIIDGIQAEMSGIKNEIIELRRLLEGQYED